LIINKYEDYLSGAISFDYFIDCFGQ